MRIIKPVWGNRGGLSDVTGLRNQSVAGQNGTGPLGTAPAKWESCLSVCLSVFTGIGEVRGGVLVGQEAWGDG